TDDAELAEALRSAAAEVPAKPVLVVHVELGGLAEALSAAMSTGPQGESSAVGAMAVAGAGLSASAKDAVSARLEPSSESGAVAAARLRETPGADGEFAPQPIRTPESASRPHAAPGPVTPSPTPASPPLNASAAAWTLHPAPPSPGKAAQAPLASSQGPRLIPAYPAAERAVRALAEAVKYAQWRREAADPGRVPEYEDIDEKGAARMIDGLLARGQGLTLGTEETCELLGSYGIGVRRAVPAPTPEAAVEAARVLGYPVALKATAPHLRHRADLGGVRLDLADEEQLRRSYAELTELFGAPLELRPVVQAMAPRGVDTVVRAVIDPAAGAVLSFGLAGAASQLLGDMAHRLVPVTDRDATSLVRSIRTAPLLFGWRGSTPVDTPALEELLLRVSRLVDDHPEVVAVTLEPVVVAPHGVSVLGASVRLAPPPARDDLGPRTLPAY
ncbi:MAG TPA: acetate--CoA ligase family protein, partial [Streptomyces sp.]